MECYKFKYIAFKAIRLYNQIITIIDAIIIGIKDKAQYTHAELNYYASQLTEIIGGTFTIQNGIDQFNHPRRINIKPFDTLIQDSKYGYINYAKSGLRHANLTTSSAIDNAYQKLELQKIIPHSQHITNINNIIRKHAQIKIFDFQQIGPVLYITPDVHNERNIIKGNSDILQQIVPHLDFIATEGAGQKITASEMLRHPPYSGNISQTNQQQRVLQIDKMIHDQKMPFSSAPIELLYGPTVDTIGVENMNLFTSVTNIIPKIQTAVNQPCQTVAQMIGDPFSAVSILGENNSILIKERDKEMLFNIQQEY